MYLIYLTVSKRELLKASGYLKVSIKEVYSATNNLNEVNFIGEGTAGEYLPKINKAEYGEARLTAPTF